jgi:hypothetical protein
MNRLRKLSLAPITWWLPIFAALAAALFVSCESPSYYTPPVVTSNMARTRSGQRVDLATLQKGRTLFAHRCLECHTLPPVWHYRVEDWSPIVNSMAHRASLKPAEREAIIVYILAARSATP